MWEGGIRVPGLMHYPGAITQNVNVTTPAASFDFAPTIFKILGVETENPSWAMDGLDLVPIVQKSIASGGYVDRPRPLGFWTSGQQAVIDNKWKILHNPEMGQCDAQLPYNTWKNLSTIYMLFDLEKDYHESHDLALEEPEQYQRMMDLLSGFLASVDNSQANETMCGQYAPAPAPTPPAPPSIDCDWHSDTGLDGSDMDAVTVKSKEECCGLCKANPSCAASCFTGGNLCHLKSEYSPKTRHDGSVACVPHSQPIYTI